jgi:signal transduction histidine kinase
MADRLAALGGRLEVRSAPGQGTTITAQLPSAAGDTFPHPAAGDAGTSGAARRPAATV